MGDIRYWLERQGMFGFKPSGHPPEDPLLADEYWMQVALERAEKARQQGEVPVGALLVKSGMLIASGFNCPIARHDPTAHAEIQTLRQAGQRLLNYRLPGTTLYVTLEPCAMCMTALVHARIQRLVFGADDPRRGAVVSALQLASADFLNHRIEFRGGVLGEECSRSLKAFFRERRG